MAEIAEVLKAVVKSHNKPSTRVTAFPAGAEGNNMNPTTRTHVNVKWKVQKVRKERTSVQECWHSRAHIS